MHRDDPDQLAERPSRPASRRARDPRAARHERTAKSWLTEARAPDDPEQPRSRGRREPGGARRLRRHRPRRAQLGMLRRDPRGAARARRRRDAADPVGQARRRVQDARRRAARADRQLEPRAALGDVGALQRARPQGPHDVRPDDGRLVDLHRHAGHRAGHLRDVRRGGPPALRRRARATRGSSPRASAAWAARSRWRRRWRARRCSRSNASRRASTCASRRATSTGRRAISTTRSRIIDDAARRKQAGVAWASSATRRKSCPSSSGAACGRDMVTDQTSAHDLVNGYLPAGWTVERWRAAQADPAQHAALAAGGEAVDRRHVEAMLAFQRQGIPTFDYGNNIRQVAKDEGVADAFAFPGLRAGVHPAALLRRQGPVPLGRAVGRSRGHLQDRPQGAGALPRRRAPASLARHGRRAHRVPGPAGAHLLAGLGERHRAGLAFNEMVHTGEFKAPIVIGRDHLDTGSVASPEPRDRSDEGRLRRRLRLAAAQRAAQHRGRRDLGVDPSRRRRRHGLLAARRRGHRLRRHGGGGEADRARAVERSGDRRHAPRRRGLREGDRGREGEGPQAADVAALAGPVVYLAAHRSATAASARGRFATVISLSCRNRTTRRYRPPNSAKRFAVGRNHDFADPGSYITFGFVLDGANSRAMSW